MTKINKIMFAAAFLWFAFWIYIQFLLGAEGDRYWILLAARMLLGGKKLYADIFDINMPALVWIYTLPAYASLHWGVTDVHALVFLALCSCAAVLCVCVKLITFHKAFAGDRKKQIEFILLFAYVFLFYTNPPYFFYREHILLLFTFPYLLRWLPSLSHAPVSRCLRIIIGCMAGIGFCIKPHNLIILAGIQILYVLRERSWRIVVSIESILIYAVGALYLGCVWVFAREYFTDVLPIALLTYSACNWPTVYTLPFAFFALFTLCLAYIDFRPRFASPYRADILHFAALCAFFFLYILANNGWSYTYNLLASVAIIANGWVLWHFSYLKKEYAARGQPYQLFERSARSCIINFILGGAIVLVGVYQTLNKECDSHCRTYNEIVKFVQDNHVPSYGTISIDFQFWTNLSRATSAQWQTRFPHLWMLPKFVASDENFKREHQWILEYVADGLAADLDRNKPEIVFVDDTDNFFSVQKRVNLLSYFNGFRNFARAWKHYQYAWKIDSCYPAGKPDKKSLFMSGAKKEPCRMGESNLGFYLYRRIH